MKKNKTRKLFLALLTKFSLTVVGCSKTKPYRDDEHYQIY